jgi:hypothetical protein
MPLKLFDFLYDATINGGEVPHLSHPCHGETRPPCPFRSIARPGCATLWPAQQSNGQNLQQDTDLCAVLAERPSIFGGDVAAAQRARLGLSLHTTGIERHAAGS